MLGTTNATAPSRVKAIADRIAGEVSKASMADGDAETARDAAKALNDARYHSRRDVMTVLCAVSAADNWTEAEVSAACKSLGSTRDGTTKAIATFINEVGLAAKPAVRHHFDTIARAVSDAWAVEKAAGKDAPKPMAALWAREHHAMVGLLREAERGNLYTDVMAITAYATANDPALQPDKVAKRVDALAEQLRAISAKFSDPNLACALDLLAMVNETTLTAAQRVTVTPPVPSAVLAPTAAPAPVAPVSATVVENNPVMDALDALVPAYAVAA